MLIAMGVNASMTSKQGNGSHLRVIVPQDIQLKRCYCHLVWVVAKDIDKYPTLHTTGPPQQIIVYSKMSIVRKLRNPELKNMFIYVYMHAHVQTHIHQITYIIIFQSV